MKRPLVAVVSCYATGLLLAEFFQPPLVALFAASFLVLVLACRAEASARRRVLVLEKLRPLLIWPLLALVGWTNLASRTAIVSPNDLRALLGDTNAIVTVRGTLIETPHLRITERDDRQTERSVTQVRVSALGRNANWQPACGSIIVTTPGAASRSKFRASSGNRRRLWPKVFSITVITSGRAGFITNLKPVPRTTGNWALRRCSNRR